MDEPRRDEEYIESRIAGPFEVYLKVIYDLGLYSNIVICATYRNPDGSSLTPEIIYNACKKLLLRHPHLSLVVHRSPSVSHPGLHQVRESRLRNIDLKRCVSFVEDASFSATNPFAFFEEFLSQRFDTDDHSRPLWRLVVMNGQHVFFIRHHLVGDGRAGIAFHRDLLAALNSASEDKLGLKEEQDGSIVQSTINPLAKDGVSLFKDCSKAPSAIQGIFLLLWMALLRLILPRDRWLFNDVSSVPHQKSRLPVPETIFTSVKGVQFSEETKRRALQACKAQSVTFTSLLSTLLFVTLAVDIYPKAKIGLSCIPIDLRRYFSDPLVRPLIQDSIDANKDLMATVDTGNIISGYYETQWLEKYRRSDVTMPLNTAESPAERIWELSREHGRRLLDYLSVNIEKGGLIQCKAIQGITGLGDIGNNEEDVRSKFLPALSLLGRNGFQFSNLGEFKLGPNSKEPSQNDSSLRGQWTIESIRTAASAQKASAGYLMNFNVISVQDGPCNVSISTEKGAFKDSMVEALLDGLQTRLMVLLGNV
ncbi:predicted protein [Paecilomyces variotii No. 5]|uniref:Alcohol acetyltransferase n=1 Tax=Byssochlamys spectabilis (strain No. 5 / NBRC 109023) TaxID=1356009 RepID=V5G832_BYSSN|nr:predicted protein [Paecilomyces variotii No. 5]